MLSILKKHKLIVIGILSVFSTSIIFSKRNTQLIKSSNNFASAPVQKPKDNNFYKNYYKKIENTCNQINTLKNAIMGNNLILKKSNMMFNHNINYINAQKKKIRNKINFSNLTITNELNILYEIKNITINHPYDYIPIIMEHNYSIPNISVQKDNKKYRSENDIKTNTSKMNYCNTNFNSITYKSEEAVIGANNITLSILGSKSLILSNIHFNYNNILYYSNNLCTLTTFIKTYHTHSYYMNDASIKSNKFINKQEVNSKSKLLWSKNLLSNNASYVNHMSNKPYIITGTLFIISSIILSVLLITAKSRLSRILKMEREIKANSELQYYFRGTDGWKFEKKWKYFQSLKKKLNLHFATKEKRDDTSSKVESQSLQVTINWSDLPNDSYDSVCLRRRHASDGPLITLGDRNFLSTHNPEKSTQKMTLLELADVANTTSLQNDIMMESIHDTNSGKYDELQFLASVASDMPPIMQQSKITDRYPIRNVQNTHYLCERSDRYLLLNKKTELFYSHEQQKAMVAKWLKLDDVEKVDFSRTLFWQRRFVHHTMSNNDFHNQLSSFVFQKHLSSLDNNNSPNSVLIFEEIRTQMTRMRNIIEANNESSAQQTLFLDSLRLITSFKELKPIPKKLYSTKYGWFETLHTPPWKAIVPNKLTLEQYLNMKGQYAELKNLKLMIPKHHEPSQYFDKLCHELSSISKDASMNTFELSSLDKLIVNEIIHDLHEVIDKYIDYLDIPVIHHSVLINNIETFKIKRNLFTKFTRTKIARDNFGEAGHFDIEQEKIFKFMAEL